MGLLEKATARKQPAERGQVPAGAAAAYDAEYQTSIDRVYFEVEKAKDISLWSLKKRLNIKMEQIEEYAEILQSRGLLDLYYTGLGNPKLRAKGTKKGVVLKKGNRIKNLVIFAFVLLLALAGFMAYINYLR